MVLIAMFLRIIFYLCNNYHKFINCNFEFCFFFFFFIRYVERGNIEATYFAIQTKIRAQRMRLYVPTEGKLISDVEKAWAELEKAEHVREIALRGELARQEKLERLAEKFNRKVSGFGIEIAGWVIW